MSTAIDGTIPNSVERTPACRENNCVPIEESAFSHRVGSLPPRLRSRKLYGTIRQTLENRFVREAFGKQKSIITTNEYTIDTLFSLGRRINVSHNFAHATKPRTCQHFSRYHKWSRVEKESREKDKIGSDRPPPPHTHTHTHDE